MLAYVIICVENYCNNETRELWVTRKKESYKNSEMFFFLNAKFLTNLSTSVSIVDESVGS